MSVDKEVDKTKPPEPEQEDFARNQEVVQVSANSQDYEVLEEMPNVLARGLVYIIAAFCICALLWSILGKVDMVVTSKGVVTPLGDVVKVQSEFSGTISEIFAREGQEVAAGESLMQLVSLEKRNKMEQAATEREITASQLKLLEVEANTFSRLAERGVIAQLESITKQKEYESAKRRLTQLESDLRMAQANDRKLLIRATARGKIAFLQFHNVGQVVAASDAVATIVPQGSPLVVEIRVPNKDIAKLKVGQVCKHMMDAFPYQDFGMLSGQVIFISSDALDDGHGSRYYVVRASIDDPFYRLPSGRFAIFVGLTGTTEIVTKRQRIISIFTEPFRKMRGGMSVDS